MTYMFQGYPISYDDFILPDDLFWILDLYLIDIDHYLLYKYALRVPFTTFY